MGRKTITNRTDLRKLSAADLSTAINVDTDPTRGQFLAYTAAYDYFNRRLWDGKLPRCLLNFSRKSKALGFFAAESWKREKNVTHEISLNPDVLERRQPGHHVDPGPRDGAPLAAGERQAVPQRVPQCRVGRGDEPDRVEAGELHR